MFVFKRYSTLDWTHIMIHHSLTKDSGTVSWGAIDRYHTENLGMDEIGYHFGLELVGEYHRICVGRTLAKHGAHCPPMNRKAIGVCVVGNYDITKVKFEQYWWLAILCRWLISEFKIPLENIVEHKDYASKSCPGKLFDIDKLKKQIAGSRV